ncbi:MAG: CPBP family glutamic-type intramembrane protease [archaeon GB-1867-035]|nr:CPBP family glutamic-type intramembrane protease [Candidatus Culexmicrobium profundum]
MSFLDVSYASILSGFAWGFWHFPTSVILFYFNESVVEVYSNLLVFVLILSFIGVLLGEVRRRSRSLIPSMILHFFGNSALIISMVLRMM